MMIAKFVGYVLGLSGSYAPIFAVAGCAYLLALAALHAVSPRLAPARFVPSESEA
jgi:ACS family hexuronate transporter-like MFS transporter